MALHDMQYLRNYTWIVRCTTAQQYLSRMLIARYQDVGMRTITSEQLNSGALASKPLVVIGPLIRGANRKLNSGILTRALDVGVTSQEPSEESKESFPDWNNVPGLFLTALPLRHFYCKSKDSNDRILTTAVVTLDGFTGRLTWLDFNVMPT
ncbi:hypothetical protein EAE99_003874 [Botrytis elliptica]|nr:hypothetical protein EAE99_003874 [Botrytis elliptica]